MSTTLISLEATHEFFTFHKKNSLDTHPLKGYNSIHLYVIFVIILCDFSFNIFYGDHHFVLSSYAHLHWSDFLVASTSLYSFMYLQQDYVPSISCYWYHLLSIDICFYLHLEKNDVHLITVFQQFLIHSVQDYCIYLLKSNF